MPGKPSAPLLCKTCLVQDGLLHCDAQVLFWGVQTLESSAVTADGVHRQLGLGRMYSKGS